MLPHIVRQALRLNRDSGILYLNNPKVGCSAVKGALWQELSPDTYEEHIDVHQVEGSPFSQQLAGVDGIGACRVVTFVRNPFARVLSAYLNKIMTPEDHVRASFCARHGLKADAEISFDQFVELLSHEAPENMDPHWRPQHLNTLYPFIEPNFVGHLERMNEEFAGLLSQLFGRQVDWQPSKAKHATGAADKLAAYFGASDTRARVLEIYRNDFSYFGYSDMVGDAGEQPDVPEFSAHEHPRLQLLQDLRQAGGPDERANILSDIEATFTSRQTDDAFCKDWLLMEKADCLWNAPARLRDHIRGNIDDILSGHEFLKRSSAKLAAGHGHWRLVRRISNAAIQGSRPTGA